MRGCVKAMARMAIAVLALISLAAMSFASAPSEAEAIPAPRVRLAGQVMLKDGVTPVRGAELTMTRILDGEAIRAMSGSGGRYHFKLTVGEYRLVIRKGTEIFESATIYRVPAGPSVAIDFLLLHDVEPAAAGTAKTPEPTAIRRAPEAASAGAKVVGTIVDLQRASRGIGGNRWAEALGFLGSLLAIALAGG